MSKSDWQVGPVLKQKLNSQGTLFRGGTKYSSDKRYPKGYTPERQQEVAEAVVRPSTHVTYSLDQGLHDDVRKGTQSVHFKDRKVRASGDMSAPMVNESAQPTRNLVDNIARSTVPVDHLRGVQFRTGASSSRLGPNVAGHWDPAGDAMTKGGPVIRLLPGYEGTPTVIHEIGHHVSHTHEGNVFPRDEAGHSGQEEARADEYAEQHFRDRRGRPQERGFYGGGKYSGHTQRTDQFWDSYGKHRTWGLSNEEMARQNEEYYQKYPEEKVHPDNTMDEPLYHKSYVSEADHRMGQKAELSTNPDAEPHWSSKYAW